MGNRIVSLVPSGTEIVAGLVGDRSALVGVTHECDYPDWVGALPKVVRPADPALLEMEQGEVDARVAAAIGRGESLYTIDAPLLCRLAPDLVVTQRLCDVCAASPGEVERALAALANPPRLVELAPQCLADVLGDIRRVGEAMGREDEAARWEQSLRSRLEAVGRWPRPALGPADPPRVLALEWCDPLWVGGHWIPEMIEWAGGVAVAGVPGGPSTRIDWEAARALEPDVVFVMCCGYTVSHNAAQISQLRRLPGWDQLAAVRTGQVHAVDANAYFSRSGPRLIDGTELLAAVLRGEGRIGVITMVPDTCNDND